MGLREGASSIRGIGLFAAAARSIVFSAVAPAGYCVLWLSCGDAKPQNGRSFPVIFPGIVPPGDICGLRVVTILFHVAFTSFGLNELLWLASQIAFQMSAS